MYRQVVLNKKGTPMSNATRCSIQLICDYVTPLNEDKDGAYSSPKFLLSFKEKITNSANIYLTVNLYQDGQRTFIFDVKGLKKEFR